jgi:YidC/Oxa1 family membrane protein insertase
MYGFISALQDAVILGRPVQSEPGVIVGPIAWVFGTILNFLFDIVYMMTATNTLGLAIILLTLVAMTIMLPLNIKAQRSMIRMQKLNPEIEKIKAKYGGKNDAETKQKIGAETQALMTKHKVNPLGSCLPMLIQMPLFFGLLYIMNQSYLYIDVLNDMYIEISAAIINVPGSVEMLLPLATPHIPDAWVVNGRNLLDPVFWSLYEGGTGNLPLHDAARAAIEQVQTTDVISLIVPESLSRVLDRFNMDSWNTLLGQISQVPGNYYQEVRAIFDRMQGVEVFLGLPLKDNSGWFPPGVIIPILAVLTTMATSWLSQQVNKAKDQQQKTMQTVMMTVMPLFMGFITVSFPAGVGLYWITSNLYRLVQQIIMNKQAGVPFRLPFTKKEEA